MDSQGSPDEYSDSCSPEKAISPSTKSRKSWARAKEVPASTRGSSSNRDLSRSRVLTLALPLRSEEHTSELQSHSDLVCRLLLEQKTARHCHLSSTTRSY